MDADITVGLQLNVIKTKLMLINTRMPCTLPIAGERITDDVESLCDLDVRSGIQKERQVFI